MPTFTYGKQSMQNRKLFRQTLNQGDDFKLKFQKVISFQNLSSFICISSHPTCQPAAGLLFPSHCPGAQQQILSDVVRNFNAQSEWECLHVAMEKRALNGVWLHRGSIRRKKTFVAQLPTFTWISMTVRKLKK